jgi:predicted unusual protein kinase regulating ubiquinone biosynthesis (AarF/ABC1/UbiB family)
VISLQPERLKRYKDLVWLLVKYGRSDLVKGAGVDDVLQSRIAAAAPDGGPPPEELARDLESLGPTFVKLGQLLSTRADLLPAPYLVALARLQDGVEPFGFPEVERIVSEELGVRISKAFLEFETTPLAAASLGQVHRAVLRGGRPVAVKVQRPGIRERVAADLEVLAELIGFIDAHTEAGRRYEFGKMLEQFRRTLLQELDYRREAENLRVLRRNLQRFERIAVPAPVDGYTTSRVLTMEYLPGTKITSLSPVVFLDVDGCALAETLFAAYLQQILVDGFFHADPHPGNVLLTEDRRLALLDLGMVARVTPRMQDQLLKLLLAITEGRAEDAAACALGIGERRGDFGEKEFTRAVGELVSQAREASLRDLQVGRLVLDMARFSGSSGLRLPPELTMLGKTLLNLDEVARTLHPGFDPNAAIQRDATEILRMRLRASLSPGNFFSGVLEAKELVERLPTRINRILDRLADEKLTVSVEAFDQIRFMQGFQKVANRITLGLVLAALIVGAALLMRVETSFRLLGYPGLAIIFFGIAALGGVALIVSILFDDD